MKLRALALLLLVANLGFFAWTQGWLDAVVGVHSRGDREPERLARQFQPQSVHIVPPNEAAAAMSAAAEADSAESLLQAALPASSWVRAIAVQPGVWLVYLGRFAALEAMQQKANELRRLQAPFEEVQGPPELVPGLALGQFDTRAAAQRALDDLTQRGVRTARVVTLAEPATMVMLRIEHADAALAVQVAALGGTVKAQPLGKAFVACSK